MRFGWLVFLILAVALLACALVIVRTRRAQKTIAWVSNTAELKKLSSYRSALNRSRLGVAVAGVALVLALIAGAFLAAAPVDRKVVNETLARRDMVLCLDASGSMLPYDGEILQTIASLVDQFSGERIALQVWSAQTVTKFPLTDDYELVKEILDQAATVIDRGYMGQEGDYVLVSPELSEYLAGVDSPGEDPIASLIGDGLASCVLGFDHRDSQRSRTIILASDNEVKGEQIYTLQQAVEFASEQGASIISLYPANGGVLSNEGEELKRVVEAAGGSFYQADDPSAMQSILENIQSQQLVEAQGERKIVETARPQTALFWATWMSLIAIAALAWRRM